MIRISLFNAEAAETQRDAKGNFKPGVFRRLGFD